MRTARLLAVVLVVVVLAVLLNSARHRWRGAYQVPPRTFDGSSNASVAFSRVRSRLRTGGSSRPR